jgi:hypothetical protein
MRFVWIDEDAVAVDGLGVTGILRHDLSGRDRARIAGEMPERRRSAVGEIPSGWGLIASLTC